MSLIAPFRRLLAGARLVAQRRAIGDGRSFNPDGFRRWQVGEATVTKVVELEGEGFGEFLLPGASARELAAIRGLPPGHLGPRGGIKLSVHSFVVEIAGRRIVVDTNVGNGKRRGVPIWNQLSTPWLSDLVRAGFPPETIDVVVCTHLHTDHVGWNTRLERGRWTPTFPNARYLFVRGEYEFWRARRDDPARAELFSDSIDPVVAAGLSELVEADAHLAPGVRLVSTPGHTDHHVAVLIESAGRRALITGDLLHHPAQLARPDWSTSFDTAPARAARTRREWFDRLAGEDTLVLGTAFPDPTAGYVRREGDGFVFEPAGPC